MIRSAIGYSEIWFYEHGNDRVYYLIILVVFLHPGAQQVEQVVYLLEES